jgi:preprotein translocase subunit YajC
LNETAIVAQTTVPSVPGAPGTGAAATQPTQDPPFWAGPMMPFILLIILMYVFMFRSKKGQEKKRQDLINALKKGDEVQTIGGEFGRVMETRDDRILLKVDESSNTKIWYARSAIHRVVTAGDKAEAK